jgi:hypothetical protein
MDCDTTHDADDIVTEEMIVHAASALCDVPGDLNNVPKYRLADVAIRAVAPMIAARAQDAMMREWPAQVIREAEREACAQIAETLTIGEWDSFRTAIAAAIRARGETP